ncbi:MAG: hypothetical protein JO072_08775 [Parafilimonas sp.]|nr:hypothetical protein [Parafilimonas sp.]
MKKIIGLSFIAAVVCLTSCKKDYVPGTTNLKNASNNWWVTVSVDGVDQIGTSVLLDTYNTAADKDSIWVDDLQNIWAFKCKAAFNNSDLTFQTKGSQNEYYGLKVKLENGKILPKAGHSKSGVVTDSIYMEAHFPDDPSNSTWVIAGVARTGLVEDDY